MDYLLPAATYQSPPRPVRGTVLNTIIEDQRESSLARCGDGSGTDTDEGTIIYNPVQGNGEANATDTTVCHPPSPLWQKKPPAFATVGSIQRRKSSDELYEDTDEETEFSDHSASSTRDSVSSRPTSFATDSDRNSIGSDRSRTRNRYPAIMIPPTDAWPSLAASAKEPSAVPPTPPPKIAVSPAALSLLQRVVPAINAPPSLDGSSMTSEHASCISAPVTPEMYNVVGGQSWDIQHQVHVQRDGESAREETENESISPQREVVIEQPIDWDEIGSFPRIPGGTPQEVSPIMPDIRGLGVLRPATPSDQGVLLPSEALQTLHQLAPDEDSHLVSEAVTSGQFEMREKYNRKARPRSADSATPASNISDYSFSQLSIPSPDRFFSSLKTGTKHTWLPGANRHSNPPSSTTAENFYNAPWHQSQAVVEHVVELDEDDAETEAPSTARQLPTGTSPPAQVMDKSDPIISSTSDESQRTGSHRTAQGTSNSTFPYYEYDEAYQSELMECAAEHLDRTTSWLAAQISYLSALRETNPSNIMSESPCVRISFLPENKESTESPAKKAVRFLEETSKGEGEAGLETSPREEHAYYQAFQYLSQRRRRRDGFVQGASRFQAVQASRIALMSEHLNRLCGRYEIREPTRPKYSGPFSQNPRATGVLDYTPEQLVFMEVEREKGVLDQISPTFWMVDAFKYLNGGNLLLSDVSKRLAKAPLPLNDPNCVGRRRMRALDLGGNTSCDWAWHCAREFPNVRIYTVATSRAATNPTVTGPPNHRLVVTPKLWRLPFKDNYFDLISARSLHAMLRHEAVPGQSDIDEYNACLRECHRVLKPGGYLEFMLMDSDMAHAGPLASAMSVEFGFKLKTRGYDALPTKSFLGRLRQTNFVAVKRAWMFLPAGAPIQDRPEPRETPEPKPPAADDAEAVHGPVGSTTDIANVTGLLGSWMWEQWMLKLQMEMGVEKDKLLKGVAAVMEESKNCEAGWRCLSGWAQKPKPKSERGGKRGKKRAPIMETIHINMAEECIEME